MLKSFRDILKRALYFQYHHPLSVTHRFARDLAYDLYENNTAYFIVCDFPCYHLPLVFMGKEFARFGCSCSFMSRKSETWENLRFALADFPRSVGKSVTSQAILGKHAEVSWWPHTIESIGQSAISIHRARLGIGRSNPLTRYINGPRMQRFVYINQFVYKSERMLNQRYVDVQNLITFKVTRRANHKIIKKIYIYVFRLT